MTLEILSIEDVKTQADANKMTLQKCSYEGQVAGFYAYLGGIVVLPVLLNKFKHRYPMSMEYKLLSAGIFAITTSYFASVIAKSLCEKKLEKQLQGILYKY